MHTHSSTLVSRLTVGVHLCLAAESGVDQRSIIGSFVRDGLDYEWTSP